MPIDKRLLRCCPLMVETDMLMLSSAVRMRGHELYDTTIRTGHRLHPQATSAVRALKNGVTYGDLLRLAEQQHIDHTALHELLGFLNTIGALRRKRDWQGAIQAFSMHFMHALIGITHASLSYRAQTNTKGLTIGVLRAITPVILATGVVAGLAGAAGLAPFSTIGSQVICWIGVLYGSILAHESGHVLVLKQYGIAADVLQRGFRLGIIHARAAAPIEIRSLLAGPVCGIMLCAVTMAFGLYENSMPLTWSSVAGMTCHALSLLPLYGDGESLQKALQKRNST